MAFRTDAELEEVFSTICPLGKKGKIPRGKPQTVRTLLSRERLTQAYRSVQQMIEDGVPGCVVECGLYRGGSLAVMALAVQDSGEDRQVWGFDTFEGHPDSARGRPQGKNAASEQDVLSTFVMAGVRISPTLVRGKVQQTLVDSREEMGPIAALRVDVDQGIATTTCLKYLYPQVSPGGIVTIDDFGHWKECRKAVHAFRKRNNITAELSMIDYTGAFWVKE